MNKYFTKLVLLMVGMMVSLSAYAYDFKVDNLCYNILSEEEMTVELYYSEKEQIAGDLSIPSSINYNGKTYTVTQINRSAFSGCDNLTSVKIPNTVVVIGNRAFYKCINLANAEIPNSVARIGTEAFSKCSSLISIEIPNKVAHIEESTFNECVSLTSVTIPNSVTQIGDKAFNKCSSLTLVEIPNSVTQIGERVFASCANLISINVGSENANYTSVDGVLYNKDVTILEQCPGAAVAVKIPNSVTQIKKYAFYDCSSLTSVEMSNKLSLIEGLAFYGCSSLTSVEIPNSVNQIRPSAFENCSKLTSINVSSENTNYTSVNGVLYNKDVTSLIICPGGTTVIDIPNSVSEIGQEAFWGCSSLTSVEIPNSVTQIGEYAFGECANLASVKISNRVTQIAEYTFFGCVSLTSVEIPNSVTQIGAWAFLSCNSLASIKIPNSVTVIGRAAFVCDSISSIYCAPATPPVIPVDKYIFMSTAYEDATLYVPLGCKSAYEATAWRAFRNIVEYDFAGVEDAVIDEVSVYVENGKIVVNGADMLDVYSIDGKLVYSGSADGVSVDDKGIYIVVANGKSYKIVM